MAQITTKTVDRLRQMAMLATAISDAVYNADHRQVANSVSAAAKNLAYAAEELEATLERYARAALADEPKDAPTHLAHPTSAGAGTLPDHPWPLGMRLISVCGECDEDDGAQRGTGPNAEGIIVSVDRFEEQGWTYGVSFTPSGVHIVLDEGDPLFDIEHYRCAPSN